MPTSSAGFFSRGKLGLPTHAVKLLPYNEEWPRLFEEEKQRLVSLLIAISPHVEHIGSTSVPGMDAKPVIDIMLGISGPEDIDRAETALEHRGYTSHGEKGIPGRLFFTYGNPPTIHLHMVTFDGTHWNGHILFRDSLRADPGLAKRYVALKSALASQFPLDRQSYTAGKADFIEKIVRQAASGDKEVTTEREKTPG